MARTAEGAQLTVRHRQAQLALRAQLLRDYRMLWPIWKGDEQSFRLLVSATIPLVQSRRQSASALAGAYFEMFRRTEKVGGAATVIADHAFDAKSVESSLYVTGLNSVRNSVAAGFSPQAAMGNAFVKVSGAMSRHVAAGARGAILASTASDQEARGFARVTGGNPCAFCAMLASRGAAYAEETVDFEAHDHCSCFAEPVYGDSELPGRGQEFKDLWKDTITPERVWDANRGEYRDHLPADALNQFRQALATRAE